MTFDWFSSSRNQRLDAGAIETLRANVWQYDHLPQAMREQVHQVVATMLEQIRWVAGPDFQVADEMRLTISGAAALLTAGLDEPYAFPRLKSIVVYPSGFADPQSTRDFSLIGDVDPIFGGSARLGEAWPRSPIILSWRHAARQARVPGRGRNLVLHEFAHHVDGLSGEMDGEPQFATRQLQDRWTEVSDAVFHELVGRANRREPTLLDTYGATNPAEFFAVSTECFFERPHDLQARHGELYELLSHVYHQSPADWLPHPAQDATPAFRRQRDPTKKPRKRLASNAHLASVGLHGADAQFARGVLLLNERNFVEAERLFSEVIRQSPEDEEALQHRGEARLGQRDFRGAESDARAALELDPEDLDAMLTLGAALLGMGEDSQVAPLLRRVLREEPDNPWARELEGRLRARANRWREAYRAFRRALLGNPYDATLLCWIAECLDKLDDPESAADYRRKAEQIDPEAAKNPLPM